MTPRVEKIIKESGKAIKCEAEPGNGDNHSGVIVFMGSAGREVLGRTDPSFESAEGAVTAMEKTVDTIRSRKATGRAPRKKKGVTK